MRAYRTAELTGPSGLRLEDVPAPSPGPTEVRIRVRATALNRADLLQTRGLYPAPPGVPADIPGMEYAGEVAEVGDRVRRWKVGDPVLGLVGGGAWAEELVAHEKEVAPLPRGFTWAQAAAIPEAFLTAWDALVTQARTGLGSRVLIHAVASGVGTAAAQLCRALGARAVGTGRSADKLARAAALGVATVLVDASAPRFASAARQALGGEGADVVLDLVGGTWLAESLEAMAPGATLMLVGLVAGATAEVPLRTLLARRLRILGTTMRARPLEEKLAVASTLEHRLVPLFEQGTLAPVIDAVLPMAELPAGLERLGRNETFGKLVLTW
jgi:putative PIG3 family NAD(P)H quinone oxidoreductase